MSLFPYNKNVKGEYIGTPFTEIELLRLADSIFMWHYKNSTSDWTQSNSGAVITMQKIAEGLAAIFAEPSFIEMLEDLGEAVHERIETLKKVWEMYSSEEDDLDSKEIKEIVRKYKQ